MRADKYSLHPGYVMTSDHIDTEKPLVSDQSLIKQDAQLSQRDRAAGFVTVFAKSRRLELGDNILRTL